MCIRDRLYQERAGICVKLVKRIPTAAGLGGASSDAAAALVAANQLVDNLLSFEQLFDIGQKMIEIDVFDRPN